MSNFADFYRYVLPHAKGAATPAMDNALRTIAKEVCVKTCVWQVLGDRFGVTANTPDYDIDAPADGEVAKVMECWFDGRTVDPKPINQLSIQDRQWMSQRAATPSYFYQMDPDVISFAPVPDTTQASIVQLRVAYKPTDDAATLPDILLKEFAQELAYGALSLLLIEENVPYTNPDKAGAMMAKYLDARDDLTLRVQKNFGRAPIRTVGRWF